MIEALELLGRLALGLATLLGLGYVLAASLVPGLTRLERAAAGFGLGALVITLWMLALSSLGLHFSLPLVLLPLLVLAAGLQFFKTVREQRHPGADLPPPAPPVPPAPYGVWDWVFIGLLIALFLFVIPRAVMYPVWAWDAISTWGFKAKVFYQRGIVDLGGFEAHNYYPDLVPLLCTYLYLWLGQVNDHLVKLVFPLWGGAFLALLFGMLRRLGLRAHPGPGPHRLFRLKRHHLHHPHAHRLRRPVPDLLHPGGRRLFVSVAHRGRPARHPAPGGPVLCRPPLEQVRGPSPGRDHPPGRGLDPPVARPPRLTRRLAALAWPLAGFLLGYLPWRLFARFHGIETGSDHILGFYASQLFKAAPAMLVALVNPTLFGILWPATAVALVCSGKKIFTTPRLFLALFLAGNFLAILLAYAVAPTSAAEFHLYLRATIDRLLLHLTPAAALLLGEGVKLLMAGSPRLRPVTSELPPRRRRIFSP